MTMYGVCRSRDADAGWRGSLTGSRGSGRTESGGYWRLPRFEGGLAELEVVRGLPSRGWRPSGEGGRWLGEPKR
eukprot:COSAG01_NODE_1217_length_11190_cov_69.180417_14_plen_74_part_00